MTMFTAIVIGQVQNLQKIDGILLFFPCKNLESNHLDLTSGFSSLKLSFMEVFLHLISSLSFFVW